MLFKPLQDGTHATRLAVALMAWWVSRQFLRPG